MASYQLRKLASSANAASSADRGSAASSDMDWVIGLPLRMYSLGGRKLLWSARKLAAYTRRSRRQRERSEMAALVSRKAITPLQDMRLHAHAQPRNSRPRRRR